MFYHLYFWNFNYLRDKTNSFLSSIFYCWYKISKTRAYVYYTIMHNRVWDILIWYLIYQTQVSYFLIDLVCSLCLPRLPEKQKTKELIYKGNDDLLKSNLPGSSMGRIKVKVKNLYFFCLFWIKTINEKLVTMIFLKCRNKTALFDVWVL